ncbi:MAG TPA: site-2 protease family protein [Acidimicrobiales bacterium]|nr:site-2 protease family protein [Acidimicrobiales bacterium]
MARHAGSTGAPPVPRAGSTAPPPGDAWGAPSQTGPPPGASPRAELARLVAVVAAVVLACVVTHTTAVLIVVVALVAMIMLHELGHFLTAKWSHMKVSEYFLGFGPRLWSVRRGETEYGIKAIPAGGYVKILGMTSAEEVDPADEPRTYRQQPFHNRLLVAVAGSAMHGVMAFVLLWGMFTFIGAQNLDMVQIAGFSPLSSHADPARQAGLRAGDVVVAADGTAVRSVGGLQQVVSHHAGAPVTLDVERAGRRVTVVVTPQATTDKADSGRIGVVIGYPTVRSNPAVAVTQAGSELGRFVAGTVTGLAHVFSPSGLSGYVRDLTNPNAAAQSSQNGTRGQSIYGAARIAVQGAEAGPTQLIAVLVLIIVSVGLLNLLPMLPLDGGHIAIAAYERIRSRRGRPYHADVTKLTPVVAAFVLLLGFIVLSSFYLDITHPVKNPFQ